MPYRLALQFLATVLVLSSTVAYAALDNTRDFLLNNLHFEQFSADGFSTPAPVHDVLVDSRNRIWIGTETGLFLYDGHGVSSFFHEPDVADSLPNSFAASLAEGPDGRIWIGTWGGGVAWFDETDRSFHTIDTRPAEGSEFRYPYDKRLWRLDVLPSNRLLLGTFGSGLFELDPATGIITPIAQPDTNSSRARRTNALHVDRNGNTWFTQYGLSPHFMAAGSRHPVEISISEPVGSIRDFAEFPDGTIAAINDNDVLLFSPEGAFLKRVTVADKEQLESRYMMSVEALDSDTLVIGTTGGGIYLVDRDDGEIHYKPAGDHYGTIQPSISWDIDLSPNGDLIVAGTTGVWIAPSNSRTFWSLSGAWEGQDSLLGPTRAIFFDDDHGLILNSGSTIFQVDLDLDVAFSIRKVSGRLIGELPGETPHGAYVSQAGVVLISTGRAIYASDGEDFRKIASFGATNFIEDKDRNQLIMPLTSGPASIAILSLPITSAKGLEPKTISVPREYSGSNAPAITAAPGIKRDILIGTFTGLARLESQTGEPLNVFADDASVDNDWKSQFISSFAPLAENQMLLSTDNGPWHATLNEAGEIQELRHLFTEHRASHKPAAAIFNAGNKVGVISGSGILLGERDGSNLSEVLSDQGFPLYRPTMGAVRSTDHGVILSSGRFGPLIFRPDDLNLSPAPAPLRITEINTFRGNENKAWKVDGAPIEFTYEDRVIRVRFGMLDPLSATNNSYEIRLIGFRDDWIQLGKLSEFSFTNLDPGSYELQIRGRNGDTSGSSIISQEFEVLPPWWQTWWAYTLYAIFTIGSIVGYILYLQRKLKREKEISEKLREADTLKSRFLSELEIKVDEATADMRHAVEALEIKNVELEIAQQRAQDASRLKSEFLANMSHEIRTPMNGVLGFTQLLKKSSLDTDQEEYVETLESSAHSLLGIINDILDLSKIEAGKLIIDNTGFNLRACAMETIETLAPVAYEKNLELAVEINADLPAGLRGDPVRLRQVLTNLVGNAIKFTESGHIAMAMRPARLHGKDALEIEITDTGRGITAEDREKLFRAFERGQAEIAASATGTGLGLVITKKLTEAMGGEIDLASEAGKGTRVTLRFPLIPDRNPENIYEAPQPLLGKKIHLADANEAARAALHEQLRNFGADVRPAATMDNSQAEQADIVALGISRQDAGNADELLARARHLIGTEKPLLCFISRTDRSDLRELGGAHAALCLPKVAHVGAQVRRIENWLRGGERPEGGSAGSVTVPGMLEGLQLLIADDNRINRHFLRKMLQSHGATVHEATNGSEALELLTDSNVKPDMALVDLHMPVMGGLELAEKAREAGVGIPLLVVSANVLQETRDAADAAGFDDYILKPVEEAALLEAVQKHVKR